MGGVFSGPRMEISYSSEHSQLDMDHFVKKDFVPPAGPVLRKMRVEIDSVVASPTKNWERGEHRTGDGLALPKNLMPIVPDSNKGEFPAEVFGVELTKQGLQGGRDAPGAAVRQRLLEKVGRAARMAHGHAF